MDYALLLVIAAAFLLAGFVKGLIGMGLPPIAIGLMALVLPPAQAAALLLVPSLVTNFWQMSAGPGLGAALRRFATLQIGVCGGTWLGAGILTGYEARIPTVALGCALAIYALLNLAAVRFHVPREHEPYLSPVIGVLTGLVMSATGVVVIPLVPYLQALEIEKEALLQALGISFVVAAVALAVMLFHANVLGSANAGGSVLALAPAALGMLAGRALLKRINAEAFRVFFQIALLALGLFIAAKAAFFD